MSSSVVTNNANDPRRKNKEHRFAICLLPVLLLTALYDYDSVLALGNGCQ